MKNLITALDEGGFSFSCFEPMKNHVTFKIGGDAELFIEPKNEEDLKELMTLLCEEKKPFFVLGNGSNLLVSDDGIKDKAVIHIGEGFSFIRDIDDETLLVGAGTNLASLCKYALSKGLSGLEFAFGIPGSVGGAVYMNAGAYGGEMKDVLESVNHIDLFGEKVSFNKDELDLSYRHSVYSEDSNKIITSAVISLKKGNKNEIEEKMMDFLNRRKDKQPLQYPSAGSVFKRPVGYFAGALIEESGLKGKRIGGAMVSEKHAGFIINYENATAKDVFELIEFCKKTVKEKFSVELQSEIKFIE